MSLRRRAGRACSNEQAPLARLPRATLAILLVTGVVTGLQFAWPGLLPALERTPTAMARHEWWRLVTPLLVHADGLKQIAFNFPAILIVGTLTERIYGSRSLWLLYLSGGLVGEIFGYLWQPLGAGASVAGASLLGALGLWLAWRSGRVQPRVGGVLILMGGGVLAFFRDIHGPPILFGAGVGFLLLKGQDRPA